MEPQPGYRGKDHPIWSTIASRNVRRRVVSISTCLCVITTVAPSSASYKELSTSTTVSSITGSTFVFLWLRRVCEGHSGPSI